MPRTLSSSNDKVFPCTRLVRWTSHKTCTAEQASPLARRDVLLAEDVGCESISANKADVLAEGGRSPRRTRQTQLTLFQGRLSLDLGQIRQGGGADHEQATIGFDLRAASLRVLQDFLWCFDTRSSGSGWSHGPSLNVLRVAVRPGASRRMSQRRQKAECNA